jgi:putative transposase
MPSRNVSKIQSPDSYYHVYARGGNKQKIFLESSDYHYFTRLFERYLSKEKVLSKVGVAYPNFDLHLELLSYCLMSNHFHILIYQIDTPSLEKFMRSMMTSYSRYFNLKYKRSGPLFESRYKAVRIDQDDYLTHITRYIHLNPRLWLTYRRSSLKYYIGGNEPYWLKNEKILDLFDSRIEYQVFVSDYEEMKNTLEDLKHQLAD